MVDALATGKPAHGEDSTQASVELLRIELESLRRINRQMEADAQKMRQVYESVSTTYEHLREILDKISDGFVAISHDWRFIYVNEIAAKLLGHTSAELIGEHIWARFPLPAHELFFRLYQKARLTGKDHESREYFSASDTWFEGRAHPFEHGVSIFFRDITEQMRMQSDLSENRAHLRLAIESSGVGFFDWDIVTGDVVYSAQWKKQLGYEEAEIGSGIDEWKSRQHPDERDAAERDLADFFKSDRTEYVREGRLRHRDGSYRTMYRQAKLTRGENGEPLRLTGVNIDVTEKKNTEEALRKTEKNLRDLQKLESIGTLTAGISHDFNNILAIILGYARLIPSASGPEETTEAVDAIVAAGERGSSLVRQMMTFARQTRVNLESVSLNDICLEISGLLRETMTRSIDLRLDLTPDLPAIRADQTQISQVILNLCINARDAMDGKGVLTVSTELASDSAAPQSEPRVVLRVTDTGSGMTEEVKERLFEPFFTTKPRDRGTGLGLAVVYGIIKSHDGLATVDSQAGQGTTFSIAFPVAGKAAVTSATAATAGEIARATATVLLAEDEEMLAKLTVKKLESRGYKVLTANNGAAALKLFEERGAEIDAILSDMGMPEMNGLELLREIRKRSAETPFIIISGHIDLQTRAQLENAGVMKILLKPCAVEELIETVGRAVKNSGKAPT